MKKIFLYLLLSLSLSVHSQVGNFVFNDTVVHTITIETQSNWFEVLENDFNLNFSNPEQYPEIYRKCNITFDGIPLNDCGFREKGNASNTLTQFGKKKPLKISFDEFFDQTFNGLKKLNLNNFTNDPSLLHDVISFKLMRDAGIIAPRTAYTKLYVNGEFIGLYLMIENVDKTFLKLKFGGSGNNGNLYKTDRGAGVPLNWQGPESDGYKEQGLKLTTNETTDDWTKLISFIDLINNNHSDNFKQLFENSFDIHTYLKVLAIEKCVRSWDSYWGGGNNYYLYEHPDGKYRWIPWDMNETFQDIKIVSGATSILDGYLVPANKYDERPLLKRIFEVEEWKTEYLNYCCELIQSNFSLDHLGEYILKRHNLIADTYRIDPYKYNTYASFEHSLTDYNEDVVSLTKSAFVLRINYPGIFPFIQSQREWAVHQMGGWDHECSIKDNTKYDLSLYPNPATDYVNIVNAPSTFDYSQFSVYDFTGRLCLKTNYEFMEGPYYTIPLLSLPSGIYIMIKNSADGKVGRGKFIVR